ncbi:hypothetical protein ACFUMH_01715 [Cellulomonas sp. NPDC057328]|uniref:hypothetical protein n=1 Tax=Cellulomonas sp. NPDC057328 TaxID=3346101 RepID=UPI003639CF3A
MAVTTYRFSSFTGFWAISVSDNHYKASGKGHCIFNFDLDVVDKGAAAGMEKEMYQRSPDPAWSTVT